MERRFLILCNSLVVNNNLHISHNPPHHTHTIHLRQLGKTTSGANNNSAMDLFLLHLINLDLVLGGISSHPWQQSSEQDHC